MSKGMISIGLDRGTNLVTANTPLPIDDALGAQPVLLNLLSPEEQKAALVLRIKEIQGSAWVKSLTAQVNKGIEEAMLRGSDANKI